MATIDDIVLFLFVAGDSPRSMAAIRSLHETLAEFVDRTFALQTVNVYDEPDLAIANRVLVTPTLLAPGSARRLVGDLSEKAQLRYFLAGLPVALAS